MGIIEQYNNWKESNPDEDYQHDQIFDFIHSLSRGEAVRLLEGYVKLKFMVDNGLGWKDMENDVTYQKEL